MSGGDKDFIAYLFFFPTLSSLRHHCDILFVVLVMPFSYED